jgi:diketogulonate reductase-like aldo/keto reductase
MLAMNEVSEQLNDVSDRAQRTERVLNNGVSMPALGLGVFQSPPEETAAAVQTALKVGYRHIDTAAVYGNERQVGEGIRQSGVHRGEVFIETKVWVSDYGYDETLQAFEKAARKLGVDQLDLLILHQPAPDRFDKTVAAYKALEALLSDGARCEPSASATSSAITCTTCSRALTSSLR